MFHTHRDLYQDPHIDYPVNNLDLDFAEYIAKSKTILANYHYGIDRYNDDLAIKANSPYELRPTDNQANCGVLLTHGLLDTCFNMKDIGEYLHSQGLLVRSIMLPGHGSIPGSLLNVTYQNWLQAIEYGVTSLAKEVDKIILVGFSLGACLSLYYALKSPDKIAGIVMLAPAYKINSTFDVISNWPLRVGRIYPRANWLFRGEEFDYTKYRSICFNAVYQVYQFTDLLRKTSLTTKPSCPIFMVSSDDDRIVSSKVAVNYFCNYSNNKNRLILYTPKQFNFEDTRITVRNSSYPDKNICNISHIAIPCAPTNPHYGIQGDYPLASHIGKDKNTLYCALDRPLQIYYELSYKFKLTPYRYERLTFNPDFEYMAQEIGKFIKNIL